MGHWQKIQRAYTITAQNVASILLISLFVACTIVCTGCNDANKDDEVIIDEIRTREDIEKADLLRKIDRKFENPDAHYQLGSLYQDDGLWPKALYHYNTALTFDPVHRDAQAAAVKTLIASGDAAKAKVSADIYLDQAAASATESVKLALAFQRQELDEHALAAYKQGLHLAPNSAKINRQIGFYYLAKNNTVLAKEYLSRSFQLNPNQPDVSGELGRLGVEVRIPRNKTTNTKKLDRMVDDSGGE